MSARASLFLIALLGARAPAPPFAPQAPHAPQESEPQAWPEALRGALEEATGLEQQAYAALRLEDVPGARERLADALAKLPVATVRRALAELPRAPERPRAGKLFTSLAYDARLAGDWIGARRLAILAVDLFEGAVPPEDPTRVVALVNLGGIYHELGELPAARALSEEVLEIRAALLPEDDTRLLNAGGNLALLMNSMGDVQGSRSVFERIASVLEGKARRGKASEQDEELLLRTRNNLAMCLAQAGRLEEASDAYRTVLTVRRQREQGGESVPELEGTVLGLVGTLSKLGKHSAALEAAEQIREEYERAAIPANGPEMQRLRGVLASEHLARGDLAEARALAEKRVAANAAVLPPSHKDVIMARLLLARILARQGAEEELDRQLDELAAGMLARLEDTRLASLRRAAATAASLSAEIGPFVELARVPKRPERHARRLFEVLETMRAVSAGAAGTAADRADPELAGLREEVLALRERVNELAWLGEREGLAAKLAEAVLARDDKDEQLRRRLADAPNPRIRADELAAALPQGSAAVGYRRCGATMLAAVLEPDGALHWLDLGSAEELASLVWQWRATIGKPVPRTGGPVPERGRAQGSAAERLRATVLDPVFAAAGEARTLFVCLDDSLHLVPLDALPLGDGLVGDAYRLRYQVSFTQLVRPRTPSRAAAPMLVALGDIDFDAPAGDDTLDALVTAPAVASSRGSHRSASALAFDPISATGSEIDGIARQFEERFGVEPKVLRRKEATKTALYASVPQARFLHLATHGYFAAESIAATTDTRSDLEGWGATIRGLAPMTLCGLALAGANLGMDASGRVPGILTAEELAGLDLGACELAVLSACDTNVGMRRAGLGIAPCSGAARRGRPQRHHLALEGRRHPYARADDRLLRPPVVPGADQGRGPLAGPDGAAREGGADARLGGVGPDGRSGMSRLGDPEGTSRIEAGLARWSALARPPLPRNQGEIRCRRKPSRSSRPRCVGTRRSSAN